MAADAISATAEGINEMRDGIPVLTRIHVHYQLRLPVGAPREKVDRALAGHVGKCPTARSLEGAVEVAWSADVTEDS
jgi:uncharacterized OsmC-like protein